MLSQLSYTPIPVSRPGSRSFKIEQQKFPYPTSHLSVFGFIYLRPARRPLGPGHVLHRKEVIQPHLPVRLPCYDLTPIAGPTFGSCLLAVSSLTSGITNFHGLTGGVYKARERIHRGMLIRDY